MPSISKTHTETDILNANPSKVTNLNFGNYLFLQLRGGTGRFRLRFSVNGIQMEKAIGRYPDISLTQAREKSKKYLAERESFREGLLDAAFSEKLASAGTQRRRTKYPIQVGSESKESSSDVHRHGSQGKNSSALQAMADAGEFIGKLTNSKGKITDEMFFAIYLLILIPSHPSELLCAQWEYFNRNLQRWTIKPGPTNTKSNKRSGLKGAFLSMQCCKIIDALRLLNLPRTGDGIDVLFPTLYGMSKSDRNKAIAQVLQTISPNVHVGLNDFRDLFERVAKRDSYFRNDIIDAALSGLVGIEDDENFRSYVFQMHALADWWAAELDAALVLGPPLFGKGFGVV